MSNKDEDNEKVVIFDPTNTQAWLSYGRKKSNLARVTTRYGKRFKTIREAKEYANELARKHKVQVYDRYEGRYYTPRNKRQTIKSSSKSEKQTLRRESNFKFWNPPF